MRNLTNKQLIFVKEYLANGWNATQAAIKAGYSEKTAYSQGQRLLKHVEIKKELEKQQKKTKESYMISAEKKKKWLEDIIETSLQADDGGKIDGRTAIAAIAELNKMDGDLAAIKTQEIGEPPKIIINRSNGD
ncbi:MAG: terminase small subunit [Pseudomonadota bacterium]|nr:terminase small subunit [Pseudomonadota bacterium]